MRRLVGDPPRKRERALTDYPLVGRCAVCGERQYLTPGGTSCEQGQHGGCDTVDPHPGMSGNYVTMDEAVAMLERMEAEDSVEENPRVHVGQPGEALIPDDAVVVDVAPGNLFPQMSKDTDVEVRMAPAFARILERAFSVNPWKEYEDLEQGLRIGERGYADRDTLARARNDAEDNARRAHALYCAARVEQERVELDARMIEGAARREAIRSLQAEKETGTRAKAITKDDVEDQVMVQFPDEYRALQLMRLKLRKLVEHMERLSDLWKSRCSAITNLLDKAR